MKITSAFANNTKIHSKYTCDGENINPPLSFLEIPANSKSLVLIMDDPDTAAAFDAAPTKTWIHWVVYNINPRTIGVDENSIPQDGIEGMTDFGKPGYGGPCPPASPRGEPSGTHRYFFKLYALDTLLNLSSPNKEILEKAMHGHILAMAELVGLYARGNN